LRNAWEKRVPQSRSICVAKSQASDIRVLEREITRIREEHAVFIAPIWLQSKIVQKGVSKCDGRNLVLDRPAFNRLLTKMRPYAADSEKNKRTSLLMRGSSCGRSNRRTWQAKCRRETKCNLWR
jgi:hypothetical protein